MPCMTLSEVFYVTTLSHEWHPQQSPAASHCAVSNTSRLQHALRYEFAEATSFDVWSFKLGAH